MQRAHRQEQDKRSVKVESSLTTGHDLYTTCNWVHYNTYVHIHQPPVSKLLSLAWLCQCFCFGPRHLYCFVVRSRLFEELLRTELSFMNHCNIDFRFRLDGAMKRFGSTNKSLISRQWHFNSDKTAQEGRSLNEINEKLLVQIQDNKFVDYF